MAKKTTGQKTGRINVKKLKGDPKELTVKGQKKVKGGINRPRVDVAEEFPFLVTK